MTRRARLALEALRAAVEEVEVAEVEAETEAEAEAETEAEADADAEARITRVHRHIPWGAAGAARGVPILIAI